MPYLSLVVLVVWIAALIDVIVTDEYRVRHLPKVAWLIIVILLPLVGSIIWFLVGRPESAASSPTPRTTGYPEYERPEYKAAVARREEEEFKRNARERAEEQRRRAEPDETTGSDGPSGS